MAIRSCALCGEAFDESELLFHARGRVCEQCELYQEEEAKTSRMLWTTVVVGPLTALAGTILFCAPLVGPFAMVLFGVMALWRGAAALQVAWSDRHQRALEPTPRAALIVSGALTSLWAFGLVLVGAPLSLMLLWRALW